VTTVELRDGAVLAFNAVSGTPVVFLHGGAGTAALHWAETMRRMPARFDPVGVDLRGHGASSGALDGGLDQLGQDLLEVLDQPRFLSGAHVVGFSMGGCSALRAAIQRPERFRSLTLVGTHARLPEGVGAESKRRFTAWATESAGQLRDHHDAGTDWQRFLGDLTALQNDVADEELLRLRLPVLVVHGDRDEYVPVSCAVHLATVIPEAELAVLPAACHLAHRDHPELFDLILHRFLDRVDRRFVSSKGDPQ
jgi:pimeloyl-ACP methyl ester carboxylesterase